jgi:hypothetical protein
LIRLAALLLLVVSLCLAVGAEAEAETEAEVVLAAQRRPDSAEHVAHDNPPTYYQQYDLLPLSCGSIIDIRCLAAELQVMF